MSMIFYVSLLFWTVPPPVRAASAEGILKKYEGYFPHVIKKYYNNDREKFLTDLRALTKEFDRIKKKVKTELPLPFKLKIGTLAPSDTEWIAPVKDIVLPLVTDISDGLLGFTLYTGGVMGEDKDILRKMKLGQLHGCGCTAQGIFVAAPELSVFSLPYLFRDYAEVDYTLASFRKEIENTLEKKGYFLFALIDTGYFHIYSKDKVGSLEDLRKQRVNTWFGDIETTFLNEAGINPIPVPVPEILPSVRAGIINVTISPAAWLIATQAFTSMNYFIDPPVFYSIAAVFFETNTLIKDGLRYGLSKEDVLSLLKETVTLSKIVRLEDLWNNRLRSFEKKVMQVFIDHGIRSIRFDERDRLAMDEAGKKVWKDLSGKVYSRETLEKLLKVLDAYRKSRQGTGRSP